MTPQPLVLILGTGLCGLRSLARLMNQQAGVQISVGEPPLLTWSTPDAGQARSTLQARFARWRSKRDGAILGDAAAAYLPYVERIIELEPSVRIVCLQRPREEGVAAFCEWLDQRHPLPINHWARQPATGWHHDPLWTRTFPQYDTQDRQEGLGRYWDEYYGRAQELADRFPQQFRLVDMHATLNSEAGQREVLDFVGIAPEKLVLADVARVPGKSLDAARIPAKSAQVWREIGPGR